MVAGTGCSLFSDTTTGFVVFVDHITAAATIQNTEPLVVKFSGTVGSDRCSRLSRVEKTIHR